jgi:hypothetical protein
MNQQKQIYRISEMMGVLNEDRLSSFIHKYFDKVFDDLVLRYEYEDYPQQMDWINKDGKKIFERNTWGRFWIYGCDEYNELKRIPETIQLSYHKFQELLIDYLNNRYFDEFGEKPLKDMGNERCEEEYNV